MVELINKNTGSEEADEHLNFIRELNAIAKKTSEQTKSKKLQKRKIVERPLKIHLETERNSPDDLKKQFSKHFNFFIRPTGENTISGLTPALLFPNRDLEAVRYDYPLLVSGNGQVTSLKDFFDQVINSLPQNSEQPESLKRQLLKLEYLVKNQVIKGDTTLKTAWNNALAALQEMNGSKTNPQLPRFERLAPEGKLSDGTSKILQFSKETIAPAFHSLAMQGFAHRTNDLLKEIDSLTKILDTRIKAVEAQSQKAYNPQALESSMGKASDELDFDSFSKILNQSQGMKDINDRHLRRLMDTHNTLISWQKDLLNTQPLVCKNSADVLKQAEKQSTDLLQLIRALRIARLEVENKYNESLHAEFFLNLTVDFLSTEEKYLLHPLLLVMDDETFEKEQSSVWQLLKSDLDVKIILRTSLLQKDNAFASGFGCAQMAAALNHPYVLQTPFAYLPAMAVNIISGMAFNGPALFSVYYTDHNPENSTLPLFLLNAAAAESRLCPVFNYTPTLGAGLSGRFNIEKTPQYEKSWPESPLTFFQENIEKSMTLSFTVGDLLAAFDNFAGFYLRINNVAETEGYVPLSAYLHNPQEHQNDLPYIKMIDDLGAIKYVLVSKDIVHLALKIRDYWQVLQELGGTNNSFVLQAIEDEKRRLEEEKTNEIDAIQKQHKDETQQTLDEISRDVIARLAAGLLSDGLINLGEIDKSPAKVVTPPATPVTVKEVSDAVEKPSKIDKEPVAVEEDEDMSFDDPYIDTPLCTSCNDCRAVNSQLFAYDENKQAYIEDPSLGTFRELVEAAEHCPVKIIHPGKPKNPNEEGLDELIKRAEKFK